MATIPINYPTNCSDKEIASVISNLSQDIFSSRGNINTVMQLSPLISLGQLELQKRISNNNQLTVEKLHEEVRRSSESSDKNEKASKRISLVALAISILSIIITIYFSVQSNIQNDEWQQKQLDFLQKISEK